MAKTKKVFIAIVAVIVIIYLYRFYTAGNSTETFTYEHTALANVVARYNGRIVNCPGRLQKYLLLDRKLYPIMSDSVVDWLVGRYQQFGKEVKRYPKQELTLPCYLVDLLPKSRKGIDINTMNKYLYKMS
jgi:hypothetical protein